jgi:hypothetical protein
MRETRVFRPLIGIQAQAELFDATQSLKLRRIDKAHHQLAFAVVSAQANDVVDRISINSFRHGWRSLIPAKPLKGNARKTASS